MTVLMYVLLTQSAHKKAIHIFYAASHNSLF